MKLGSINVSSAQRSENGAVKIKTAQVILNACLKLCVPTRSSFVCGLAGALASNPVDVVRTRMMNQRGGALYQGTLDCLLQVSNTAHRRPVHTVFTFQKHSVDFSHKLRTSCILPLHIKLDSFFLLEFQQLDRNCLEQDQTPDSTQSSDLNLNLKT